MDNKEFIEWTKFLDQNGAFSISDELENDFVKTAEAKQESFERDPNLPEFDENILGKLGNVFNWAGGGIATIFSDKKSLMPNRLKNLRSFFLSPLSKDDRQFRLLLWDGIEQARKAYGQKIDPNIDDKSLTNALKNADTDDLWNVYGNWVNLCRQIFGSDKKAQGFLLAITRAEQYLATKVDPDYKPKVSISPSAKTPSGKPSSPDKKQTPSGKPSSPVKTPTKAPTSLPSEISSVLSPSSKMPGGFGLGVQPQKTEETPSQVKFVSEKVYGYPYLKEKINDLLSMPKDEDYLKIFPAKMRRFLQMLQDSHTANKIDNLQYQSFQNQVQNAQSEYDLLLSKYK